MSCEIDWDGLKVLGIVILLSIAVIAAAFGVMALIEISASERRTKAQQLAEEEAEKQRAQEEKVRREQEAKRQMDERVRAAEEAAEAERVRADQRIAEAEAAAQALLERQRSEVATGAQSLTEIDQRLRDAQLAFERQGGVITVRVFMSITGRVGLEWVVGWNRPQPPKLVIRQDPPGRIDNEVSYRGLIVRDLNRGKTYAFKFSVCEQQGRHIEDLDITVRVPTPKQWSRTVEKVLAEVGQDLPEQRRLEFKKKLEAFVGETVDRTALMKRATDDVKKLDLSPEAEDRTLAMIEAWFADQQDAQP